MTIGRTNDVESHIGKLMDSSVGTCLVISLHGSDVFTSDEFVQFERKGGGIELFFPLVSEHQRSLETVLRHIADEEGLKVTETMLFSDRLLLCHLDGNVTKASQKARRFVLDLLSVNESTELDYAMV